MLGTAGGQMLGTAGGDAGDSRRNPARWAGRRWLGEKGRHPDWLGREVGANCPGILTFLNSPACDFVVLMFSHVVQRGREFACNSVNNKRDIFTVFTGDPHELILGWVISQTM